MKQKLIIILGLFITSFNSFSQNKEVIGEYSYSSEFFHEYISLLPNGQFTWKVNTEWLKLQAYGNWQVRADSLILDSSPQKDKLLVWESRPNNSKQTTFYVSDKMKTPLNYTLCVITTKNDTIKIEGQFQKTILDDKVKAFYVIDTKGLYSPTYHATGKNINRFDIFFETTRIFENEHWLLTNGHIIPRGPSGAIQKYELLKK